jgi:two-component system OmpR family sensor kinase
MRKSVRFQLTLWYIGSISLLILIFGLIAYFSLQTILIRNLDAILYNGGEILSQALSEYTRKWGSDPKSLYIPSEKGDEFLVNEINGEVKEIFFLNVAYVQLIAWSEDFPLNPDILAKTTTLNDHVLPLSPQAYRAVKEHRYFPETISGVFSFPLRMLSLQVYDQNRRLYILQLALSLQHVHTTLQTLLFVFSILSPVLLTIIVGLGYWLMKRAFAPVKKMVAVTRSITAEDLSLRLEPIESRDEIGELADTLNDMIARLEHSFNQMKQFSGDASHELKTPLANLKCNAEVALHCERTPEEYQQVLHDIIKDTENLQKIVEDLLLLARMDSQSVPPLVPLALHELFLEVFEETHLLARQKNLALGFETIEQVTIKGDTGSLKRVFTNLIGNAIQYTPAGGKVTFALQKVAADAVLVITDTGIGIPADALSSIFDRFYRVDPSRSHETGGSGLGLAIAQKIVAVHQGTISVQSTVGQGTTFRVSFPCLS